MDLKSAYDSVWISCLLDKLIFKYNIDGNIIAWMKFYFHNRFNRVKFNGKYSDWMAAEPNLPQGDPLSCILFCLMLNDYESKSYNVDFSNFADDCILDLIPKLEQSKFSNDDKYRNRLELQNEMDNFWQFTLNNQLVLKKVKCSTLTFSRKTKNFRAYVYNVDGNKLKVVHALEHAPQNCKHLQKANYVNANIDSNSDDSNGDSDLNNIDYASNFRIEINSNGTEYFVLNDKNEHIMEYSNFRKRSIKNNKNTDFRNISNKDKLLQQKFVKFPLYVRILGVFFDPKLFFNEHIKLLENRINKDIFRLIRIKNSNYPDCKLNSFTTWKLFVTQIRPKIEYGLCTFSSSSKFINLERVQNRAIRIASGVKKQVATIQKSEIINNKSLNYRLNEQQIKLWIRYNCAPKNYLQNRTFNSWKNYILKNGGNINYKRNLRSRKFNINEKFNINCNNLKYTNKSPLSRAYNLVREIMPSDMSVFLHRKPQLLKPLPIYIESFPSNICIKSIENLLQIDNKDYRHCYRFYTDGSCIPNPGPGASAFFSDNFSISSNSRASNHDTTINSMELDAIDLVFESLLDFSYNQTIANNHFLRKATIFTDSLFVCTLLSIDGYPKFAYYYEQMNKIIHKANILDYEYKFKIDLIKVKSHVNIEGNVKADNIAKETAKWAKIQKNQKSEFYNTYYNPIMVDIAFLKSKLDLKYSKLREMEWNRRMNNIVHANIDESNNLFYGSEFIFDRIMFKEGKLVKRSNLMRNELKYLSQKEGEIINKLRTEQINLNYYKYYYHEKSKKKEEPETDGSCIHSHWL